MPRKESNLNKRIKEYIIKNIQPSIQMDGGDVEFVDFNESKGLVRVKLFGACVGCPMAGITLKIGIEQQLKQKFKQIEEVMTLD